MAEYDAAIPPGGTGKIVLKVKTKGIQGRRTKSARVETNDPAHARFNLQVAFLAEAPVEVYPGQMVTLSGFAGEKVKTELVIHRPDGEVLLVDQISSTRDGVQVQIEKVDAEHADSPGHRRATVGDYRLYVEVVDTQQVRSEAGYLKFHTNHPERPEVRLPLRLRVRPQLEFQPQRIQLRATAGAEPVTRTVSLRNGKRKLFHVKDYSLSGELSGVGAARVERAPSSIQQFRITVDPKQLSPGVYQGTLRATTDIAGYETAELPIRVTVVASR